MAQPLTARPTERPIHAASKHPRTVISTYASAFIEAPSLVSNTDSSANADQVVNPPSTPLNQNTRHDSATTAPCALRVSSIDSAPMRKQPSTLTPIVASGSDPGAAQTPMAQLMDAALLQGIDEGIDAADVATAVVDAIRAEQFWILTHADMRHLPVERMERAQRQENPG